jgi:hypothetical protein
MSGGATHSPVAISQSEVAPEQAAWFVCEHGAHVPLGWQASAPACPAHPLSSTHGTQVCVVASHAGVATATQSAFDKHPTQTPVMLSQSAVSPVQSAVFVVEHWPHWPEGWHAGVPACPVQPVSSLQPTHVFVVRSQVGCAGSVQSAF